MALGTLSARMLGFQTGLVSTPPPRPPAKRKRGRPKKGLFVDLSTAI